MARIRTIKPEFAHDEKVGRLTRDQRLLFVLLWPIADDDGRFRAHPTLVKSGCFPYDEVAASEVGGWLAALNAAGLVRLYEANGQRYGVLVNFRRHQRIERPTTSRLPPPPEAATAAPQPEDTTSSHVGVGEVSVSPHRVLTEPSVSPHGGIGSGSGSGMDVDLENTRESRDSERGFTTTPTSPPPQPSEPTGLGRSRRQDHGLPDPAEEAHDPPTPKAAELGRLARSLELRIDCAYVQAWKRIQALDGWGMTVTEIRAAIDATPGGKQAPWTWAEHVHRQHRDAKAGHIA